MAVPEQILELFPIEEITHQDPAEKGEMVPTTERLKRVGESLVWQKPVPPQEGEDDVAINRPGSVYKHYRTIDSLPDSAKPFYNRAGQFIYSQLAPKLTCAKLRTWGCRWKC